MKTVQFGFCSCGKLNNTKALHEACRCGYCGHELPTHAIKHDLEMICGELLCFAAERKWFDFPGRHHQMALRLKGCLAQVSPFSKVSIFWFDLSRCPSSTFA